MHISFLPTVRTSWLLPTKNPFAQNKPKAVLFMPLVARLTGNLSTANLPPPQKMMLLLQVGLALILPSAGIAIVFALYLWVLWHPVHRQQLPHLAKVPPNAGMTTLEIQCIPVMAMGGTQEGSECAVCLEEMGAGEPARVLPPCSHAFHVPCADAWLARNAVCPVCRAKLIVGIEQREPQQNC